MYKRRYTSSTAPGRPARRAGVRRARPSLFDVAGMAQVVLVHDEIGGATGMGRVTRFVATTVLDQGWGLTVVASRIDDDVAAEARVVRVRFDRRLPAIAGQVAWAVAARRQLREHRGDLVHVHSPQLISVADLMTCHHMMRPAYDHGVLPGGAGVNRGLHAGHEWARRSLDHRAYVRRKPETRITFVSEFLKEQFSRYYGEPFDGSVIPPPAPAWRPVTHAERAEARHLFGVSGDRVIVGYLGGDDPRKGIGAVRTLDREAEDMEILVAGPRGERVALERGHAVGFQMPDHVIAASDVVVAPALFDAAPVAVLQSIARGVPVVVGAATGWARAVEHHCAGAVWYPGEDLASAVRAAASAGSDGCQTLAEEIGVQQVRARLLEVYRRAIPRLNPV